MNIVITFLTIISISTLLSLFINNSSIIITSFGDKNQTITSNQSDSTFEWRKYTNETIGVSLEYPSDWEIKYYEKSFEIRPIFEKYPRGEYPFNTKVWFFYLGQPTYDNIEVISRIQIISKIDEYSDKNQAKQEYELIEKPSTEKYLIDGVKTSAYSYRTIHHSSIQNSDFSDEVTNFEVINLIQNGELISILFMYTAGLFEQTTMNQIRDHILDSIQWF